MSTKTLLTAEQFERLPDVDALRHELHHGELIEVSSGTPKHALVRDNILFLLKRHCREHTAGQALGEIEFRLGEDTVRRPDVAVLNSSQWDGLDKNRSLVPFAPSIAIEVAAPSDTVEALFGKALEYLAAGTAEVWVVVTDPVREVHVFQKSGGRRVVREHERIEAEGLAGFTAQVADFFLD